MLVTISSLFCFRVMIFFFPLHWQSQSPTAMTLFLVFCFPSWEETVCAMADQYFSALRKCLTNRSAHLFPII